LDGEDTATIVNRDVTNTEAVKFRHTYTDKCPL
jgi:hypothetical protein